jgi:protein-S-isoprenylcysteine O-methyltransferase
MISTVMWVVVGLFPVSEIALTIFKRSDAASAQAEDRGSLRLLWLMIGLGVSLAVASMWVPAAGLRFQGAWSSLVALTLLLLGLAIRWSAIVTLGRHFTVDVAIHRDHQLVERGLYRFVRHPSYSGLLLAFLGLGVAYANWLSLAVLMVPITAAVIHRIAQEEQTLHAALGPAYAAYCARVKRLVPGLY